MTHSSSHLTHRSGVTDRRFDRNVIPSSSERTKRDAGASDDTQSESAPQLSDGVVLAGRYRVLRRLGRGGFSDVYLAHDPVLDRLVAIKRLLLVDFDPQLIRVEAKTLASLDHPGVVRIYDICVDTEHGYLVVMQYVSGPQLREFLHQPISIVKAVDIAIRICGGLIHAHSRGVVHRDIKPTNILISAEGEPLIADFGLAFAPGNALDPEGGTPRYMSPEQIRNETKRIGPSSDIFSTGVLLYEMLVGRVPFDGQTAESVMRATLEQSPAPLQSLNPDIPIELDRIVRRALRKNVKDRYSSMEAFQAALIQWLMKQEQATELSTVRLVDSDRGQGFDTTQARSTLRNAQLFTHRGLQPFEFDDAKFYLSLIPGGRDASGLPESLQFWKSWIESYDTTEYSRVAVLYGPSGSGKTSLVRAGIVPHLAPDVLPLIVDCRKGDTPMQLAAAIARQVESSSVELMTLFLELRDNALVRGEHRKAVVILDQFDSWAGYATVSQLAQVAAALRHCDGEALQVLLVVRDEFWIATTEFMHQVECGLEQWKNARAIELLDRHHAERLLESAGRSYGSLPTVPEALSRDQLAFLSQVVEEMAENGRILPIQLAMFIKMAKLQRWHPDTLKQAGGVQGVHIAYFQDLFESNAAPQAYQRVCAAVVEVLYCLLPSEDRTSRNHYVDFASLEQALAKKSLQNQLHRALHILVEDLRIVVRYSRRTSMEAGDGAKDTNCNDQFHLVHEFLRQPIANWVDQVRKSTWRGRSASRLEELSNIWSRKQHKRYLPTLIEFLAMRAAVPRRKQTPLQQRYLQRAGQKHLFRSSILAAMFVSVCMAGYWIWLERERSIAIRRDQVVHRVESIIRGPVNDFASHLNSPSLDPIVAADALRPWLGSSNEKLRIRSRLLNASLHHTNFESLIIDWEKIESELAPQVVKIAEGCPDARTILAKEICEGTGSVLGKAKAAMTLAQLGDLKHAASLFDYSNPSSVTEETLRHAIEWCREPKTWLQLAVGRFNEGATYHALCALGNLRPEEVPAEIMQAAVTAFANDPSPSIRSAAHWLRQQSPSVALATQDACRMRSGAASRATRNLALGIEQVLIEPTPVKLTVTVKRLQGGSPKLRLDSDVPYWISSAPITNAQFEEFWKEFSKTPGASLCRSLTQCAERPAEFEADPRRAATGMNPSLIFRFCNWLSHKEGLQPVYLLSDSKLSDDKPTGDESVARKARSEDSEGVSRHVAVVPGANGFRIPTLHEMIFATGLFREGSASSDSALLIYNRGQRIVLQNNDNNFYASRRLARSLMPNRMGVHFDSSTTTCWTFSDGVAWNFCVSDERPFEFKVGFEQSQDIAALWLVSDFVPERIEAEVHQVSSVLGEAQP